MGDIISGSRRLSSAELLERAAKAASGFAALGVVWGDCVALYLRNDFAFFEASFAAGLAGAYSIPLNWHSTQDELRYLLEDSGAKALVVHADLHARIRDAVPQGVSVLIVPTPDELRAAYGVAPELCSVPADAMDWNAWLERHAPLAPAGTSSPGSMIYTSGTTGRPRAVKRPAPTPEQAERFNRMSAAAFGLIPENGNAGSIVAVMTGPMYHTAPNAYGLAAARIGANVILQPRFDARELLRLIDEHRATHMHMVPVMFQRLLKLPDGVRESFDPSPLRHVVHGAAPCSPEAKRRMIEWWGPVINEYYGATEVGPITLCNSHDWLAHPGTVGRPMQGVSLRVLDGDGRDLPPGETGEIACRNGDLADFTYRGDDEKRRRMERSGLVALGDIGYLDADGFLHLCDRAADTIISGGVNIYPAEIEAALLQMPGVADCAVFGIPDEEFGESVCAAVQLLPAATAGEADIRAFLGGRIARYKIPKTIAFRDDLPREDSGKIFKRRLREPYWAGRQRRI